MTAKKKYIVDISKSFPSEPFHEEIMITLVVSLNKY